LACLLPLVSRFAQTWTQTSAPSNYWSYVASSADGSKLAAVADDGGIYISTNSGTTWLLTSAPTYYNWNCVASSADGITLAATAYGRTNNAIYISTNSGTTWILSSAPTNYAWDSIASSADGTKLAATAFVFTNYAIYTSTNSGTTWTPQTNAPNDPWESIASSADGSKLVVQVSGAIYRSADSGVTWSQIGKPFSAWPEVSSIQVIASSADGTRLVAAFIGDSNNNPVPIYISTNSGTAWAATSAPSNYWAGVASSADGTKLVAAAWKDFSFDPGPIYTSTNSGATWTSNTVPSEDWRSVASSADGNKLVAVSGFFTPNLMFTLTSKPSPSMNITSTNGNLTLSWTVPSTNFVMQQSPDLQNWTNTTITPTLNLTNLQEQVILSPTNGSGFYRLKTP
jgi:photosystem II stability/assembly factor-like uncharacterized protein